MAATPPEVSVILPVRNGMPELLQQLDALTTQDFQGGWEVLLVDNGSVDGGPLEASRYASRLRLSVVVASDRPGQAYAINRGADIAQGRYLLMLDADDVVTPGYVSAMAAALDRHSIVGARLDSDTLNPPWLRESRPLGQADGIGAPLGFLPAAGGCALGVRRDVFRDVGGFDVTIAEGNDIDFSWRAKLKGYEIGFVPDAVVMYRFRSDLRAIFGQASGYGASSVLLYKRYRGLGMRRRSVRGAVRFQLALLPRIWRIRSKADMASVAFLAGYRFGMIRACIRQRVVFL